jgi:hypothetical protein
LYTKEGKLAEVAVEVGLEGTALLTDPLLNKGMAFSEAERTTFSLHGRLPPHVATLDEQVERQLLALRTYETNLERHLFLCDLQDTNETLFYALIARNLNRDAAAGLYPHGRRGLPGVQPLLALSTRPVPELFASRQLQGHLRPSALRSDRRDRGQ